MAGLLVLASCTATQPVITKLEDFTAGDLADAIKLAQGASPPDVEAVQCFSYLQSQLGQVASAQAVAPIGGISAFELGHLAVAGSGPSVALELACGPYYLSIQGGEATLLSALSKFAVTKGLVK